MTIFFKEYKLNKVLSLHEQMVFKFLACRVQEKNKYKDSACLSKSCSEAASIFSSLHS
jgi:hypothetical protein